MTRHIAAAYLCVSAAALAEIGAPRAGCVHQGDGSLRALYGVAEVFVTGQAAQTGVVSAACSERLVLAKTARALELRDSELRLQASWPAPRGEARFAFLAGGAAAIVYYAQSGELLRVEAGREPQHLTHWDALGDRILAIASPAPGELAAVSHTAGGIRLARVAMATGAVLDQVDLDGVAGPVALTAAGALVYAQGDEAVLRRADGQEQRFPLPAQPAAMYVMGDEMVAIGLGQGRAPVALKLRQGRALRIPGAAQ
ncbi:MAG: hypothetical protein ACM336_08280 [Acidobacteriota bacterium]